jgi:methionyl aminopeptidase
VVPLTSADLSRPLLATDIVNVDITLYYNGFHGDTSATFVLPAADAPGRELVRVTREALELGISVCGPGKSYASIGRVIE